MTDQHKVAHNHEVGGIVDELEPSVFKYIFKYISGVSGIFSVFEGFFFPVILTDFQLCTQSKGKYSYV